MKKFLYSLIALMAMSFTFVACEQQPKEPEEPAVESNCEIYSAQYIEYEEGAVYVFEVLSDGLEANAQGNGLVGSGDYCIIMLYAQAQEDGFPKAKTYNVITEEDWTEDDTEFVAGGTVDSSAQPDGTFAYVIENGEGVDGLLCQGGTMKVEGNATKGTMIANFEFMNSKGQIIEKEFIYSGKFNMEEVTVNAPRKIQINK